MRLASVVWFERVALSGVALDLAHLVLLFDRRVAVDGVPLALGFTILVPVLAAVLVLLVSRRGSRVARGMLAVLVGLAVISAVAIGTARWSQDVAIAVGAVALVLQVGAVALSFTPSVVQWMRSERVRRRPG